MGQKQCAKFSRFINAEGFIFPEVHCIYPVNTLK